LHNIIVEKLSGVTCICDCVHSSSTPVFRTLFVLWILSCGWEYKNAKIWIFPFFFVFSGFTLPYTVFVIFLKKKYKIDYLPQLLFHIFRTIKLFRIVFQDLKRAFKFTTHSTTVILYDRVDEVHWRFRYYTIRNKGERNVIRTK